jgi:peptidoglycan/xylan/chitin deacetylase (PgdA/CDA1 family)
LTLHQPPFGDVDDRIRAIAELLGLRTIMWGYDSDDWRAGVGGVTPADVDANYQQIVDDAISGWFDTV